MEPLSLLLIPTALISVSIVAVIVFFAANAARGAAEEMGRAALAEAAPWIARVIPSLVVRFVFMGADSNIRDDLHKEIAAVVEAVFEDRANVSDRARGIFIVLAQTLSLAVKAHGVRSESLLTHQQPKLPDKAVRNLVLEENIPLAENISPEELRRILEQAAPALSRYTDVMRKMGEQLTPALDRYAAIHEELGAQITSALDAYNAAVFDKIGRQVAQALESYAVIGRKIQYSLPSIWFKTGR